jgi:hypothetical protein
MNQSKPLSSASNQNSKLAPRDVSRVSFFGGGGGGGGAVGWQEVTFADGTAVGQGYGITYEASPVAGFEHRLTIDTNSSTTFLGKSVAAYVYFDTGVSLASLSTAQSLVMAARIECSIDPTSNIVTDNDADYAFGPFIANDQPPSATMGVWGGGVYFFNTGSARLFGLSQGGFNADTTVSLGGALVSGFDPAADRYEGPITIVQPLQTGTGAAPTIGIIRSSTSHYYEDTSSSKTVTGLDTSFTRVNFGGTSGTGNIFVGGMFGQSIRNAAGAESKTLDFNIRYLLASQ